MPTIPINTGPMWEFPRLKGNPKTIMEYASTFTVESKVAPGVVFTLRRMTKRLRDDLEDEQEVSAEKMRPLIQEIQPLEKEVFDLINKKESVPPDKWIAYQLHMRKIRRIERQETDPRAIRFVVLSVTGYSIDGAPATVDSLIANAPDDLYDEISNAVKHEIGLDVAARGNSESPSTSAAAEGGTGGDAANAEQTAKTTTEVV